MEEEEPAKKAGHEEASPPLSARRLAKNLIPNLAEKDKTEVLEEFLLWPPDLFAFTSLILSITGAYHLTISPPRYRKKEEVVTWPPKENRGEIEWRNKVAQVGLDWRNRLRGKGKVKRRLEECKQGNERKRINFADRHKLIERYTGTVDGKVWTAKRNSWVPPYVGEQWALLREAMDDERVGNVFDLLCEDKPEKEQPAKKWNDEKYDDEKEKNWNAFKALMTLHAIADEACSGWGIRNIGYKQDKQTGRWELVEKWHGEKSESQKFAEETLESKGTLATINNQRCRILPKRHTPDVGITLRSLTANLAYHRSSVNVQWKVSCGTADLPGNALIKRMSPHDDKNKDTKEDGKNDTLSILLLPWPIRVHTRDFKPVHLDPVEMDKKQFGFFCYSPIEEVIQKGTFDTEQQEWQFYLRGALEEALRLTKEIDIVVLPESALTKNMMNWLEEILVEKEVSCYITGIRSDPGSDHSSSQATNCFHKNAVHCKLGSRADTLEDSPFEYRYSVEQYKHHRWKLNERQVNIYNLGHVLSPNKEWWEAIEIPRRQVTFINIGEELTICPLICEDLARQDPIADLIRTVGPSLVITILMDGPQRRDRWSAKYASVLAEDPGSAVITLTSIGMVNRWLRSRSGELNPAGAYYEHGAR